MSGTRCALKPPRFHTIQAAHAMSMYRSVHAGPKIHGGGFQDGFLRPAYQEPGREVMLKSGAQKVSVIQPMRPRVLWVLLSGFML